MLRVALRSLLKLLLVTGLSIALVPTKSEGVPDQGIRPQALHSLAEGPAELKPLSKSPINIKMVNDSKIVYETIGKLAGLSVIFDPDFPARRISVELADLT